MATIRDRLQVIIDAITGEASTRLERFDRQVVTLRNRVATSVHKAFSDWGKQIVSIGAGFIGAQAAISATTRVVDTLTGAVTRGVGLAAQYEVSVFRLDQALRNAGVGGRAVTEDLKGFADQMQRTTQFTDDQILPAMARIAAITGKTGSELKDLTRLTLDAAVALDRDLNDTAILVAKSAQGVTDRMNELGFSIDKNIKGQSERAAAALALLTEKFGGTAEAIGVTLLGATAQLTSVWDTLLRTLGQGVTESDAVRTVIDDLRRAVIDLNDELASGGLSDTIDALVESIGELTLTIAKLVRFAKTESGIPILTGLFEDMREMVGGGEEDVTLLQRAISDKAFQGFRDLWNETSTPLLDRLIERTEETLKKIRAINDANRERAKQEAAARKALEGLGGLPRGEGGVAQSIVDFQARSLDLAGLQAESQKRILDTMLAQGGTLSQNLAWWTLISDEMARMSQTGLLQLQTDEARLEEAQLMDAVATRIFERSIAQGKVLDAERGAWISINDAVLQGNQNLIETELAHERIRLAEQRNRDIMYSIINAALSLSDILIDTATGAKQNFSEAMLALGRGILKAIAQALILEAIYKSIARQAAAAAASAAAAAATGSGFGGISLVKFSLFGQGGLVGAAAGGEIVGGRVGRDSVPALLTPGEVVLDAPVVKQIKRSLLGGSSLTVVNQVESLVSRKTLEEYVRLQNEAAEHLNLRIVATELVE